MDENEVNDEGSASDISTRAQIVIFGTLTALILAGGAIFVTLSGDDSARQDQVVATEEGSDDSVVSSALLPTPSTIANEPNTTIADEPNVTSADDETEVLDNENLAGVDDDGSADAIAESASVTTTAGASISVAADEPAAVGVDASPAATTASSSPGAEPIGPSELSYPTLPDGSPVPVIALFDVETIALSGVVPTEDARRRLETLAVANSKFPNVTVVNFVTVNPDVPISVGVRVIELNSVRFPEASARISSEHATELDRVGAIMNALPNTSVLVIGHADQRGRADDNLRLSEQRAQAVVSYLADQGLSASRLSSRAVGSDDLYTLNNDDAALALNRRTEFVFFGLLVG